MKIRTTRYVVVVCLLLTLLSGKCSTKEGVLRSGIAFPEILNKDEKNGLNISSSHRKESPVFHIF
jgi:hypothetical protein